MTAETTSHFFSVIVPCFDVSQAMTAAIQSVLKQHYQNFELLLVVPQHIEKKFDADFNTLANNTKVRKINIPYGDENVARVFGAKNAKGSHLCFVSAGDEWYAQHLSVFNDTIEGNKKANVLISVGEIESGLKKIAIKVSGNVSAVLQHSLNPENNFSLTQFCINKLFFDNETIPVLKFYSFSDTFIIRLISASTEFIKINQITCNCKRQHTRGSIIELIDRQILTTVYISRNKLNNSALIKENYFNSYFWAIKKLMFSGSIKLSLKYLLLYVKTLRRLNLNQVQ